MLNELRKNVETIYSGMAFIAVVFAGMVIDSSVPAALAGFGIALVMAGLIAINER